VRQNPQASLLFSDPTGSGLTDPPMVLVQGDAAVTDQILTSFSRLEPELGDLVKTQALNILRRQPAMKMYINNPLARYLTDWYFMRLIITLTPRRIQWWQTGDQSRTSLSRTSLSRTPIIQEVNHVA
jgi:hypothetical protein